MNTDSKAVKSVLLALTVESERLEKALERERAALRARDVDRLAAVTLEKKALVRGVGLQENRFFAELSALGLPASPDALLQLANRFEQEDDLFPSVERFRRCAARCRELNQENSVLTNVGISACNRLLALIRGSGRVEQALYGPEGLQPAVREGAELGEA